MSVVDPSVENLETIVNNVQQLRLARLSALVVLLWDHSMCSFPIVSVWVNVHWLLNDRYQSSPLTKRYVA